MAEHATQAAATAPVVLVCGGERDVRLAHVRTLMAAGYRTRSASSAAEAAKALADVALVVLLRADAGMEQLLATHPRLLRLEDGVPDASPTDEPALLARVWVMLAQPASSA